MSFIHKIEGVRGYFSSLVLLLLFSSFFFVLLGVPRDFSRHSLSSLQHLLPLLVILSRYHFFLLIKSSIMTKKESIQDVYRRGPYDQQKEGRSKEETNKPAQKDHTLGIAIEPIKKQSNKSDIRLWNEASPCKKRTDNRVSTLAEKK